ncbi:hypothetical protein BDN71DRAFT_1512390 [Pleurotus eryngii]|uniref:Uncharacterized protein n=1 Tax=Pleurotus eryngii TaxID=5323 RepID=A0A9P6D322_PLEER|nr:hypothetical protein BDN71DRAFT_1512390 [Pleurotus eryngii]
MGTVTSEVGEREQGGGTEEQIRPRHKDSEPPNGYSSFPPPPSIPPRLSLPLVPVAVRDDPPPGAEEAEELSALVQAVAGGRHGAVIYPYIGSDTGV